MCGKKLVENLTNYFDGLSAIDINTYKFDRNQERTLPCIVNGYDGEEMSFSGGYGHYTVSAYTNICFQGYEDGDNTNADYYAKVVIDALSDIPQLKGSVNKPLSGSDTRPAKDFKVNGLLIRGVNRNIEGNSEEIEIRYDAFCAAKD